VLINTPHILLLKYATYVVKWLAEELTINNVVLVPGSNDLRQYNNEFLTNLLEEEHKQLSNDVKNVGEGSVIHDGKKILLYISPRSLGKHTSKRHADVPICGQHYRFEMGSDIILILSIKTLGNQHVTTCCLMMTSDGIFIPVIFKRRTDFSILKTVKN